MLRSQGVFPSFAVRDSKEAQKFYEEILGLTVTENTKMVGLLHVKLTGDTAVLVYPKPDHVPAVFTVLNLVVDDIDKAVDELAAAGVTFDHITEGPVQTDEKGIARGKEGYGPSIAWFKDPSGNILAVGEFGPSAV